MKIEKVKIFSLFLCLLPVISQASAKESYVAQAGISKVSSKGFHKILLSSEHTFFASRNFANLRLFNKDKKVVPYIIRKETDFEWNRIFRPFEPGQVMITQSPQSTTIFINNQSGVIYNQFLLEVKSNELNKVFRLSGSDDNIKWYPITGEKLLGEMYLGGTGKYYKTADFVPVNYRYYRLVLNDTLNGPYNILKTGALTVQQIPGVVNQQVRAIEYTRITHNKAAKKTLVKVQFLSPENLHQLKFSIASPERYRRDAVITFADGSNKNDSVKYFITLNSNDTPVFEFPELYVSHFTIEINDMDNEPLQIDSVNCYQYATYLVADLSPDNEYTLMYGQSNMAAPEYDLQYFLSSISKALPSAYIGEVQIFKSPHQPTVQHFWQKGWFMWACIGIVGVVVCFFTISLLRDMKTGR